MQMQQSKLSMPSFDDQTKILTQEQLILHFIHQNDFETLKEIGITTCIIFLGLINFNNLVNINYLESYSEIEVDSKISPMICACYLGRVEIVKLLLQNISIDVDLASDDSGQTPLTISAITGNYEIIKLLVDADAEVNKPNGFNQTPLLCCFTRLEEVNEKNVFENRKICMKMAELLLSYGADLNWIVDKSHGYTVLMQLCAIKMDLSPRELETNFQIIKFLLENGARKDLLSVKNKTIMELADKHKNKEKIQELLMNCQQLYFYNQKPLRQIQPTYKPLHFEENANKKKLIQYLPFCNK